RVSFKLFAPNVASLASYASRESWPLYSPRLLLKVRNAFFVISSFSNQIINRNEVLILLFTVADAEIPLNLLELSTTSSNPSLIPNANLIFNNTGEERFLQITPTNN